MKKRWAARPAPYLHLSKVGETHGLPQSIALLLARRGYSGKRLEEYLNPDIRSLTSWRDLSGISEAAERTVTAIRNSEQILVHGDYDADGITATVLLCRALGNLGARIAYFIPDRFSDGYGMGDSSVQACLRSKTDLLITVDCGISAIEHIDELNRMNIDTIITDHHQPGDRLPSAKAIINPVLDGDISCSDIAGVGVAWMFICAVYDLMNADTAPFQELLQLVAIGTVTDVVELTGDNRILVLEGLKWLRSKPMPGISALAESVSVEVSDINSSHLAFYIGPRLNASGRVGHASQSVDLLLAENESEAEKLLRTVVENNRIRQQLNRELEEKTAGMIAKLDDPRCIVLADEGWHQGVLGIVASRLVARHGVPVILISIDGESGHGSARSIPGIPIYSLLKEIHEQHGILDRFGGHPMAAGLAISKGNVARLREYLQILLSGEEWNEYLGSTLYLDGSLEMEDYSIETIHALERLEPFGEGNRMPVWLARGAYPLQWRAVGQKKNHLSCSFRIGSNSVRAIGFNMIDKQSLFSGRVDLAFTLAQDTFRNDGSIQLMLKDIRRYGRADS